MAATVSERPHPLAGSPARDRGGTWDVRLDLDQVGYLLDHRVFDWSVMASAAYLEIGLAMGPAAAPVAVDDVEFHEPLFLSADDTRTLRLKLEPGEGSSSYSLVSLEQEAETLHATGSVRSLSEPPPEAEPLEAIKARCTLKVSHEDHYEAVAQRGGQYGPAFRGVRAVWVGEREAIGRVELPEGLDAADYRVHPALLDACLQVGVVSFARVRDRRSRLYVPARFGSVRLYKRPGRTLWSHALEGSDADPGTGELRLIGDEGELVAHVVGIRPARSARNRG